MNNHAGGIKHVAALNEVEVVNLVNICRIFDQQKKSTKAAMAMRMNTSRSALDRLLDPDNDSVTLKTLQNAASAIGAHLEMKLVFNTKAA
jgi:hypothetical protein